MADPKTLSEEQLQRDAELAAKRTGVSGSIANFFDPGTETRGKAAAAELERRRKEEEERRKEEERRRKEEEERKKAKPFVFKRGGAVKAAVKAAVKKVAKPAAKKAAPRGWGIARKPSR